MLAGWVGLRACEIAQLRGEALRIDQRLLIVEEGKGGDQGTVPMSSFVLNELASVPLREVGWLWPRATNPRLHITAATVSRACNSYLRGIGAGVTLHQFRHRFGTLAYQTTRDLRVTQELLRHSSPVTTALYSQLEPGDRMAAVEGLPTLPPPG